MNEIIEAIILGLVQGLTEFIPVSSSGHLDIVPKILGFTSPTTAFITFLHLGTLAALLLYFRIKIINYIKSSLKVLFKKDSTDQDSVNFKVVIGVFIASIPAALIGLVLEKSLSNFYDSSASGRTSELLTVGAIILVGILFLFANRLFKNNNQEVDSITPKKSLIIGLSQALALFRGTSRSGITLLTGQATGLSRVAAAEFGFLMSIPITAGASLFGAYELFTEPTLELQKDLPPALIGLLVAAVSGYIAIKFLLNFLKTKGLTLFGVYRIIFGLVALVFILSK